MNTKVTPSKKLKEIYKSLGNPYEIKVIDLEHVIYRNLGNGYDFEVSGLDNNLKSFNATLYVWDISNGTKIVETISNISSLPDLTFCLEATAEKYLKILD